MQGFFARILGAVTAEALDAGQEAAGRALYEAERRIAASGGFLELPEWAALQRDEREVYISRALEAGRTAVSFGRDALTRIRTPKVTVEAAGAAPDRPGGAAKG